MCLYVSGYTKLFFIQLFGCVKANPDPEWYTRKHDENDATALQHSYQC